MVYTQAMEDMVYKYYNESNTDIIQYRKLSEADKIMFSKDIVARIVKSIEDREYVLDTAIIDKSKGNIEDLQAYPYIKDSLSLLTTMSASQPIPYLNILNDTKDNLIKFKYGFNKGYTTNKAIIKLFYSSIVLSLIQSISFLISTTMDYIKDPMGNYVANVKYNLDKRAQHPTVNLDILENFNKLSVSGEMDRFFQDTLSNKLSEGEVVDAFVVGLETGFGVVGFLGQALAFIAKLIPSIPEMLRMFVSMIYYTRVSMSDYLRLQAHYIDLNLERQKNLVKPNKVSIKKQEKIMKDLIKLADKIDIDQKSASKATKVEIEQQNKNISKQLKEYRNDTIETKSSNIEEIIL